MLLSMIKIILRSKLRGIFLKHFKGSYNADIVRASCYWMLRVQPLSIHQPHTHFENLGTTAVTKNRVKFPLARARAGRG